MNYTLFGADASMTKADLEWFLYLCQSLKTDIETSLMQPPYNFLEPYAKLIEEKSALYNYAVTKLNEAGPSNQVLISQNAIIIEQINKIAAILPNMIKALQHDLPDAIVVPAGGKVNLPRNPSATTAYSPTPTPPSGSILAPSAAISPLLIAQRKIINDGLFNVAYSPEQLKAYGATAPVSPTTGTVAPTPMPSNAPSTATVATAPAKSDVTVPLVIAGGAIAALLLLK